MIANPAGIEDQRECRAGPLREGRREGNEACLAVGRKELAISEETCLGRRVLSGTRPLEWLQVFEGSTVDVLINADVEVARAIVLERRQGCMFGKNLGRRFVAECVGEPHAPCDLRDDPPIGTAFAGAREEWPLSGDAAFRIGDGAVFFTPAGGGQRHMRVAHRVSFGEDVGNDDKRTGFQRGFHRARVGHRVDRIGCHDPERFDASVSDGAEHLDGLEAGLVRDDG